MKRLTLGLPQLGHIIRVSMQLKSEIGILYVYRIISLVLTTAFYLFSGDRLPLLYKVGVTVSLFVSSVLVLGIYQSLHEARKSIPWALVLVETLGISILLIPTGGLSSPFMWYALNAVLASICFLTAFFSWINLLFYCSIATIISYLLFNPHGYSLLTLFSEYSHVFLVFILITYAVQLLVRLLHKSRTDAEIIQQRKQELEQANERLTQANKTISDSLEHIMTLYQCVGAITAQTNKKEILQMFAEYAFMLSGAKSACYYPINTQFYKGDVLLAGSVGALDVQGALRSIVSERAEFLQSGVQILEFSDHHIATAHIKNSFGSCGLLGIIFEVGTLNTFKKDLYVTQLEFLAQLCSVVMERFVTEEMENHLLIAREQNRIAGQMHDSVSQRLFSIVCATHTMLERWQELQKEEMKIQLELISNCAASATRELRACIYELSNRKRKNGYFALIRRYLEDLSRLNSIEIKTHFCGNDNMLTDEIKDGINRMLREAASNSIRHGKCDSIDISVIISDDVIRIRIADDGVGFAATKQFFDGQGLGLQNMRDITHKFNGIFSVNSNAEVGTEISIVLPLKQKNALVVGGAF